jgi:hypothetical protein
MLALIQAAWAAATSPAGAIISGALALILAVIAGAEAVQVHDARAEAVGLHSAIEAPATGWAARLAACSTNATNLQGQLQDQSAAIKTNAAAQAAKLAEAAKIAAQAEQGRARAEALVQQLSAYRTPAGSDACADLEAADAAVLRSLQ